MTTYQVLPVKWDLPKTADYSLSLRFWTNTVPPPLPAPTALPCNQYGWPLPSRAVYREFTWTDGPPTLYNKPFNATDWPLPQRQDRIAQTWIAKPQITVAAAAGTYNPSRITDAPVRLQAPVQTWTQTPRPPAVNYIPGRVTDWGAPSGPQRDLSLLTWATGSLPFRPAQVIVNYIPGRITDWGVPEDPRRKPPPTWVRGALGSAVNYIPGRVTDWGTPEDPRRKPPPTWVRGALGSAVIPSRVIDWDMLKIAEQPIRTWIVGSLLFRPPQPQPPRSTRAAQPLPVALAAPLTFTWTTGPRPQPVPVTVPANQRDWPNPRAALRDITLQTWARGPSLSLQLGPQPCVALYFGNPELPWFKASDLRRNTSLYSTPAVPPPRQNDWQNPRGADYSVALRTWSSIPQQAFVTVAKPVAQNQWPLSLEPSWQTRTWIGPVLPAVSVSLPVVNDTSLPPATRQVLEIKTWISGGLRVLPPALRPANQRDWPNPGIAWRDLSLSSWTRAPQLQPFGPMPCLVVDFGNPQPISLVQTWLDNPIALKFPPSPPALLPKNRIEYGLPPRAPYRGEFTFTARPPIPPPAPIAELTIDLEAWQANAALEAFHGKVGLEARKGRTEEDAAQ